MSDPKTNNSPATFAHPTGSSEFATHQGAPPEFATHKPSSAAPPPPHYYENPADIGPVPVHPNEPARAVFNDKYVEPTRLDAHGGGGQYVTAMPLHTLSCGPAPVDCPACGRRAMTATATKSGNFTHLWAAVACFTMCLGCVPYLIGSLKDVTHSCGNCGTTLAVWHRGGGGVDVMAYQLK